MKTVCKQIIILAMSLIINVSCTLNARISSLESESLNDSGSPKVDQPTEPSSPIVPTNLSYVLPQSYFKTTDSITITPITDTTITEFSISPQLPSGLSLNASTGVISGNPTSYATKQTYQVTGKNSQGGQTTASVEFELANNYVVNTTNDSSDLDNIDGLCLDVAGQCSIRAAIEQANALGAQVLTVIDIPSGTFGVDNLPLIISARMILKGAGKNNTILDGKLDGSAVANILSISAVDEAAIEGISIKRAEVSSGAIITGVGINSLAKKLTLKDCAVRENKVLVASSIISGIGLAHSDTSSEVLIDNCDFVDNLYAGPSGPTSGIGGGLAITANKLTIKGGSFSGNGFPKDAGSSSGGGAYISATGAFEMNQAYFTLNRARNSGAGILLSNSGNIKDSTFYNNDGAANIFGNEIYLSDGKSLTIESSLIQLTTAKQAFRLSASATMNIINSTLQVASTVANISNSQLNFDSSTLSVTVGTAFLFPGSNVNGNVSFKNSIVDYIGSYTAASTNPSYTSLGYNVFAGASPTPSPVATDIVNTNPQLSALAANGGATKTMQPASFSAAVNLIPVANCLSADQRGISRILGTHCDAGAYQY